MSESEQVITDEKNNDEAGLTDVTTGGLAHIPIGTPPDTVDPRKVKKYESKVPESRPGGQVNLEG